MNIREKSNTIKVVVILACLVVILLVAYFSGLATTIIQIVYLLASFVVVLTVYVFGVGSWWGFLSSKDLRDSYPGWSAKADSQEDDGSRVQPNQKNAVAGEEADSLPGGR